MSYWKRIKARITLEYRLRLWHFLRKFRKEVTVSTKQGVFTLPLEIDDSISRSLFVLGGYEFDLVSDALVFIRNQKGLPKGQGTIIDIGANNGVISIGMLVNGEFNRAIAIEPAPKNFFYLTNNVKQNHLETKITCLNYALSDSKASLQFELSDINYGDHRVQRTTGYATQSVITVEGEKLDNILKDLGNETSADISLVWIDVQGYEGYVFLGARNLLSRDIPVVAEIWPYGLRRSGMDLDTYFRIVQDIWSFYWVKRKDKFVKYPINVLYTFFEELGYDGKYDNVIFTKH